MAEPVNKMANVAAAPNKPGGMDLFSMKHPRFDESAKYARGTAEA
jgi:hypothetical protein